jgi:putative membrane protein
MQLEVATVRGLAITGCVFCGLLAAIHIYIFVFEAMLWRKRAAKAFQYPQSAVDSSAVLAANQGFYNLLLAAGLIWGLAELESGILLFFLAAISTAGIFGAITSSPRILIVQVIPSFLGFIFVDFGFVSTQDWSYWRHPLYILIIYLGACLITAVITLVIKKVFLSDSPGVSSKPSVADNGL